MSSNYRFGDGLPSKSSRVGPIRRFKTANLLSGPYRGANLLNGTYRPSETAASAGSSLEGTLASIAELIGPIKSDGPYTAREMALADLIGPLLSAGPYTAREEAPRGQQAAQGPLSLADLIGPLQSDGPYTAEHMTPPDMASELIGPLQSSGPYSAYGPAGHQAEYAEISGYPFQPPQKLSPMEALRETQQQMVQAQEPEPPPIGSITRKADGTTDLKGVSSKFLEDVMGQMSDLKTMKTAAMARVAQLRQQESSGSPLLDALSQFAGNMASNDPTMPGWVRALGQTNLQMGSQGIKRERMAEEQKAFAYGKELSDTSLAAARLQDEQEQRALAEEQKKTSMASIAEKSKIDATFKIHDDAIRMVEQSGVLDVQGTAKKMMAMGIPEDQIIAEIEGLQQYADDRAKAVAKLKEAEAKEDNAKEIARAKAMLAVVDARGDITERRIQAKEDAELRGREHSFKMKVMSESKPSAVVDAAIREASQFFDTIDKGKKMLSDPEFRKKFGFGKGWLSTRKPFMGSEEQKMLSVSIDTLSEAAKAAGLKPLSDTDLRLLKGGIFDPNKSPEANDEVLRQLEVKVQNLVTQIMEYNQSVDWAAKADGLPKFAKGMIPRLMERRKTYFSQYAPPGVEIPETPFAPEAPAALPKKKGETMKVGNVTITRN